MNSAVAPQPLLKDPVKVTKYYAAGQGGEEGEGEGKVCPLDSDLHPGSPWRPG